MKKKVAIGDKAQIGPRLVQVLEPYKVPGHWKCLIIRDTDTPQLIGRSVVYSGGSIALHRVK